MVDSPPDYYGFDEKLRYIKIKQSETLFTHEIDIPDQNASTIYKKTLNWLENRRILEPWKTLDTNEPNLIRIKYLGSQLSGLSIYFTITFNIENAHVLTEVKNELNGNRNRWMWKSAIESYYQHLGISISGGLLRQFYTVNELKIRIRNLVLITFVSLASCYGFYFYETAMHHWPSENVANVFFFTLPITFFILYLLWREVLRIWHRIRLM